MTVDECRWQGNPFHVLDNEKNKKEEKKRSFGHYVMEYWILPKQKHDTKKSKQIASPVIVNQNIEAYMLVT